ncbi:hypothetical protein DL96DRAFT_1702556 [Flagelloscypha sp. PMI_526]|nr:hypothetical protein DL96DRAFT_1702556 [Flagelloscypha sp. PMI_526]
MRPTHGPFDIGLGGAWRRDASSEGTLGLPLLLTTTPMSWFASRIEIALPRDASSESCSSSEAAFLSATRPSVPKAGKLRKFKLPPPSAYAPPNLSFYPDNSPPIPEDEIVPYHPPSRTPSRLRKRRNFSTPLQPEAATSSPNLVRRSTTSFSLWPKRHAKLHASYEHRKSTSESGHDNAYFLPRSQVSAYLQSSASLPVMFHSQSNLSIPPPLLGAPIIDRADVAFGTMSHQSAPQSAMVPLPCVSPVSPIDLSSANRSSYSTDGPISPTTSLAPNQQTLDSREDDNFSSDSPQTETSASPSTPSSNISRSKSLSKLARALSFNRSSKSLLNTPSASVQQDSAMSVRRKSTKRARFRLGSWGDFPIAGPNDALPQFLTSSTFGKQTFDSTPFIESPTEISPPKDLELPRAPRMSVLRREPVMNSMSHRRWSVAGALMDEGVSDEFIVQEVEKMRALRREWRSSGAGSSPSRSRHHSRTRDPEPPGESGTALSEEPTSLPSDFFDGIEHGEAWDEYEDEYSVFGGPSSLHGAMNHEQASLPGIPFPSPRRELTPWASTRRALLVVRELLNTERTYLASLRELITSSCQPPPPPLMITYAVELEAVSAALLDAFKKDPTVWGVSRAFLVVFAGRIASDIDARQGILSHKDVESYAGDGELALSRWSAVVGEWLASKDEDDKTSNKVKKSQTSSPRGRSRGPIFTIGSSAPSSTEDLVIVDIDDEMPKPTATAEHVGTHQTASGKQDGSIKRLKGSWRRSMPTIANLGMTPISTSPPSLLPPLPVPALKQKPKSKDDESGSPTPPKKIVYLNELAILPTQRIVRYVLLYRDLLAHTPSTSIVHPLLQHVNDVCMHIARKCDRAQGNAAFLFSDSS